MRLTLKVILIICITATLIITGMFFVLADHFEKQVEGHLLTTARTVYNNILIIRKWVSDREGVFVVRQNGEAPNPFLPHPMVRTEMGDTLMMRNPALLTRELSELSLQIGKDFSYHLASINYINPANQPDEFEREALLYYEKNIGTANPREFYNYQAIDSVTYFRYFAPLYTEQSCLSCHAKEGYKLGDVRGGISILLDAEEHQKAKSYHFFFFTLTACLTVIMMSIPMIFAIKRSLIKPLREIEYSTGKIRDGDYDFELQYKKRDEIGSLVRAFENMRLKMKDYTGKLKMSETKYRSLIEHSLEAVAIVDGQDKIIECNSKLTALSGYPDDELKGRHLDKLLTADRHQFVTSKDQSNVTSERFESELLSKDQLQIPVEIYRIKGFSLGEFSDLSFIYIRDLTERKKVEKLSIQAEKMFALGQISSGIAHEIRNPLFALNNNLGYLKTKFGENENFVEIYPEFRDGIDRIHHIVSVILDYARPHDMEIKQIQLAEVIEKSLILVHKQLENSSIKIETDFAEYLPEIEADPYKLEQVFMNLFLNAFQAMPSAGVLKISVQVKNGKLAARISDTGVGMSKDEIKRVFDPFFSKSPNGTGLGMSIVQRILDQHDANYRISSESGLGTTFHIFFNLKQEQ